MALHALRLEIRHPQSAKQLAFTASRLHSGATYHARFSPQCRPVWCAAIAEYRRMGFTMKSVLIVGCGFVGVEFVRQMHAAGNESIYALHAVPIDANSCATLAPNRSSGIGRTLRR